MKKSTIDGHGKLLQIAENPDARDVGESGLVWFFGGGVTGVGLHVSLHSRLRN